MRTQTNTINLNKTWRQTEHRFYAEIVTDITTRNSEREDTQKTKKMNNTVPIKNSGVNSDYYVVD